MFGHRQLIGDGSVYCIPTYLQVFKSLNELVLINNPTFSTNMKKYDGSFTKTTSSSCIWRAPYNKDKLPFVLGVIGGHAIQPIHYFVVWGGVLKTGKPPGALFSGNTHWVSQEVLNLYSETLVSSQDRIFIIEMSVK
jgi:hypothetical protein